MHPRIRPIPVDKRRWQRLDWDCFMDTRNRDRFRFAAKSGSVRRWVRVDEDEGDRRGRARRLRRDADVLRRYRGALATHLHKQRNRTAQQRDKAQNLHDQHISRRKSALMLVARRLKHIAYREWDSCCSLDASLSKEQPSQRLAEFAQNY